MAFEQKTWTDRLSEYPNRRQLTKSDGTTEIVDVARLEGTISQEGDAFSAENMNDLEDRIADGFALFNMRWNSDTDAVEIYKDGKWEFWKAANMLSYDSLIPILTADSSAILRSFSNYDTHKFWRAFDGSLTTWCIAAANTKTVDSYFGYNFSNEVMLRQIVLKYATASSNSGNYTFKVQYMKDGSWYDYNDGEIFSIVAETEVKTLKIDIEELVNCTAFRLYFTGGSTYMYSQNNYGLKFIELQAYGRA